MFSFLFLLFLKYLLVFFKIKEEFVMSKVSCDEMRNMDMIIELLRPQLEVTKEDIEPVIIMGLYHHRDLTGSPSSFIKLI